MENTDLDPKSRSSRSQKKPDVSLLSHVIEWDFRSLSMLVHNVELPTSRFQEGYHLTEDMADQATDLALVEWAIPAWIFLTLQMVSRVFLPMVL